MSNASPSGVHASLNELIETARSRGIRLRVPPPLESRTAAAFRTEHALPPESEIEQVLRYANGLSVGGLSLCSAPEVFKYGGDMLSVQNWGNGDFDCVVTSISDHLPLGAVVFTNHQSDVRVEVAPSIDAWLKAIASELRARDSVWHPRDYYGRDEGGVYAAVLGALRNEQCELGRWIRRMES